MDDQALSIGTVGLCFLADRSMHVLRHPELCASAGSREVLRGRHMRNAGTAPNSTDVHLKPRISADAVYFLGLPRSTSLSP